MTSPAPPLRNTNLEARLSEYLSNHQATILRRCLLQAGDLGPLRTRLATQMLEQFLDVLRHDPADRAGLDDLVHAFALHPRAGVDPMRLLGITCAITGAAFVGETGADDELAVYLSVRFGELARAFERALLANAKPLLETVPGYGNEVVEALMRALDARDDATCRHSRAVGAWSLRLGRELHIGKAEVSIVHASGLLHDIGKIATPREILLKAGPLDNDEWETMRAHTWIGAEIVARLPSVRKCVPAVRGHHERYDGLGYPDRLAGTSIPFIARIVAVADAFHAMTSHRPYQRAMTPAVALHTLIEGRGLQWDPQVVDAMVAIIRPIPHVERGRLACDVFG